MTDNDRKLARLDTLRGLGASPAQAEALLAYNENYFTQPMSPMTLPLGDERFVSEWSFYAERVRLSGTILSLAPYLVQLQFPIEAGISKSAPYIAATQQGKLDENRSSSAGLQLHAPGQCTVEMYASVAGSIPVVTASVREDFVSLVRALGRKNEPEPLPQSMGALMIAGYRNWNRVREIQLKNEPSAASAILQDRSSFQDRFILLSREFYSGVSAAKIGKSESDWRETSWMIRREHEVAHYFCRRVLGSMRNNLLDEILADYCGIVRACGRFQAEWLLLFLGLENYPSYRAGARLENYRGTPAVDDDCFRLLQRIVYDAAQTLEEFDRSIRCESESFVEWPAAIVAMSGLYLEEIASKDALKMLHREFTRVHSLLHYQNQCEEVSL